MDDVSLFILAALCVLFLPMCCYTAYQIGISRGYLEALGLYKNTKRNILGDSQDG